MEMISVMNLLKCLNNFSNDCNFQDGRTAIIQFVDKCSFLCGLRSSTLPVTAILLHLRNVARHVLLANSIFTTGFWILSPEFIPLNRCQIKEMTVISKGVLRSPYKEK